MQRFNLNNVTKLFFLILLPTRKRSVKILGYNLLVILFDRFATLTIILVGKTNFRTG